jgi:hypothetical protein
MDLEFQDPSEVWWEYQRRSNPDQWARKAIPSTSALYVFKDKHSEAGKPANKPLQPTSRAKRKAKSKRRSSSARG